jgi:hypothetical protein
MNKVANSLKEYKMINTVSLFSPIGTRRIIALLLGLCLVLIGSANAAGMFCRSDPIVYLSDGTRLQFNAKIQTSLDDVIGIRYELHVPAGVQIDRIVYTPNWARTKETVELIADQPAGRYQISTVVQTGSTNVGVTIEAMKVARQNHGEGSTRTEMTGVSGQVININF